MMLSSTLKVAAILLAVLIIGAIVTEFRNRK